MMSASSKSPEGHGFILAADVDDTLVPIREHPLPVQEQARADLGKLARVLKVAPHLAGLGTATGNSLAVHDTYNEIPEFGAFIDVATFKITSVGTALHRRMGNDFLQDTNWPPPVDGWRRPEIKTVMDRRAELESQPLAVQTDHKLSYFATGIPDSSHDAYVAELMGVLEEHGEHELAAQINFSSGEFLDFLPVGVHKGSAYGYVIDSHEAETGSRPIAVAAGNSMNDRELLAVADFAIVPGNADPSLKNWAIENIPHQAYVARDEYAAGILEGLHYAGNAGLINFSG